MKEAIDSVIDFLRDQVQANNPIVGIVFGMAVIVLESMLPILPLAVFIAVNMLVFDNVLGFIISWVATVLGCILAFTICRKGLSDKFYSRIKQDGRVHKFMQRITRMKFSSLVIITALPFTPAFAVNIAAGLSKISFRKFLVNVAIAKLAIVYFWGFIGTTFLESVTDMEVLVELGLIMMGAYVLSKLVMKKFNIE